jgi:RND superfamily putative drug exporter
MRAVTAERGVVAERTRLGRLAAHCYDRRRPVLWLWIGALVGIVAIGAFVVKGSFEDKFGEGRGDSRTAQTLLDQRFPTRAGDTADIVFHTAQPVSSAAVRTEIDPLLARVSRLPRVTSVRSPFAPGASSQIARDSHTAFAVVQFDARTASLPKTDLERVVDTARAADRPGFEVELGGQPINKAIGIKTGSGEFIGVLAAILILLLAFGSVIAMGLPIMTALFGIGLGIGVIDLISRTVVVPTFGTELAAMIGLGVGIDYALFIVTRYRQGLHDGREPRNATVVALATSGRAVLFAGCTVVISLLGMMLLGQSFVYGLAFSAIAAVVLVMAASLTLLPAMLGFAGHAIDRLHVPRLLHRGEQRGETRDEDTLWYRWSRFVQRRPWVAGTAALAVLAVLVVPLFSMRLAFTDAGNDPTTYTTRRAYDLLAQSFGPGVNGPLVLAVDLPPGGTGAVDELAAKLAGTPGVQSVAPPQLNQSGDAAVIVVTPTTSPQDSRTQDLVHHLRDTVVPPLLRGTGVRAYVGGVTAAAIDVSAQFARRLVWVIAGVLVLSFVLLMAVFRSLVVPLKAVVMNLLSIGASYGVIVAVFQWGWLGSVIGIGRTAPVDPWIPLMLFTILFGLSMDYEVFLLSRIRERWRATGDNATAVADGLAVTGRVITAAAAIMVCVFGSFVLGDVRALKLFGLGLAVAVFVDATVVRCVLVPATMELLGRANWWLPRTIDRFLPTLGVEVEAEPPSEAPAPREPVRVGSFPDSAR